MREDQNENIMPSKKKSTGRIDGIPGTIIALSRAVHRYKGESIYNRRPWLTTVQW